MKFRYELSGRRFGKLKTIGIKVVRNRRSWRCRCDCGNEVVVEAFKLVSGHTRSCGCLKAKQTAAIGRSNRTHGLTKTPIGSLWASLKKRCYNPNHPGFHLYGGRGIRVCDYIRLSPQNLLALLGKKPKGRTIDRKDNDAHYSCGACRECRRRKWKANVRWATAEQQQNNKRNNRWITIAGTKLTLAQWSRKIGIHKKSLLARIANNWTDERLLLPSTK